MAYAAILARSADRFDWPTEPASASERRSATREGRVRRDGRQRCRSSLGRGLLGDWRAADRDLVAAKTAATISALALRRPRQRPKQRPIRPRRPPNAQRPLPTARRTQRLTRPRPRDCSVPPRKLTRSRQITPSRRLTPPPVTATTTPSPEGSRRTDGRDKAAHTDVACRNQVDPGAVKGVGSHGAVSCGDSGWPTGLEPVTFGATIRCSWSDSCGSRPQRRRPDTLLTPIICKAPVQRFDSVVASSSCTRRPEG